MKNTLFLLSALFATTIAAIPGNTDATGDGYPYMDQDGNLRTPEGRILWQDQDRLTDFSYAHWNRPTTWLYRAKVISVYPDTLPKAYPKMKLRVDSCLYGDAQYVGDTIILDIRGNRQLNTYPTGYWDAWLGKSMLAKSYLSEIFGEPQMRMPLEILYETDISDFDDVWYFSQGDTVWNDWSGYGSYLPLKNFIDSLRIDSARIANTPVAPQIPQSTGPGELWTLDGQKVWQGQDWRLSEAPAGAYLWKTHSVTQRIVLP